MIEEICEQWSGVAVFLDKHGSGLSEEKDILLSANARTLLIEISDVQSAFRFSVCCWTYQQRKNNHVLDHSIGNNRFPSISYPSAGSQLTQGYEVVADAHYF